MNNPSRTIRLTGDRIMVRPLHETRSAIIHIPETSKGTPTRGLVMAVGKGVTEDIRTGQEVIVSTIGGSDFDFGFGIVKIFDTHQVLAIVN